MIKILQVYLWVFSIKNIVNFLPCTLLRFQSILHSSSCTAYLIFSSQNAKLWRSLLFSLSADRQMRLLSQHRLSPPAAAAAPLPYSRLATRKFTCRAKFRFCFNYNKKQTKKKKMEYGHVFWLVTNLRLNYLAKLFVCARHGECGLWYNNNNNNKNNFSHSVNKSNYKRVTRKSL